MIRFHNNICRKRAYILYEEEVYIRSKGYVYPSIHVQARHLIYVFIHCNKGSIYHSIGHLSSKLFWCIRFNRMACKFNLLTFARAANITQGSVNGHVCCSHTITSWVMHPCIMSMCSAYPDPDLLCGAL